MRVSDELETVTASFFWGGFGFLGGDYFFNQMETRLGSFQVGAVAGVTAYAVSKVVHPIFLYLLEGVLGARVVGVLSFTASLLIGVGTSVYLFELEAARVMWVGVGILAYLALDILLEPFPALALKSYLKG